jgi:hypothetical protein
MLKCSSFLGMSAFRVGLAYPTISYPRTKSGDATLMMGDAYSGTHQHQLCTPPKSGAWVSFPRCVWRWLHHAAFVLRRSSARSTACSPSPSRYLSKCCRRIMYAEIPVPGPPIAGSVPLRISSSMKKGESAEYCAACRTLRPRGGRTGDGFVLVVLERLFIPR